MRQRGLLGRADVFEAPGIPDQHASARTHRLEASPEALEGQPNRRQFDPADRADHAGLRHPRGHHPFDIAASSIRKVSEATLAAVALPEVTTNGSRKVASDRERGVRILEAVGENQVESTSGEVSEGVFEIARRSGLYQGGFRLEPALDQLQTLERGSVPPRVTDRPGNQQRHAISGRASLQGPVGAVGAGAESARGQRGQERNQGTRAALWS